jgi:hypothetical protein
MTSERSYQLSAYSYHRTWALLEKEASMTPKLNLGAERCELIVLRTES